MWYDEAVVYQIYPLGLCGAPLQNDGDQAQAGEHRILRVLDWVEHIKRLGATCVLFNPLFESDAHGYDTRDYNKVDCRLGTNDDLRQVCAALHAAGIKILFDGVFNHVGRGFWAFKDVQEKRWDSPYKDWFHISFDGKAAAGHIVAGQVVVGTKVKRRAEPRGVVPHKADGHKHNGQDKRSGFPCAPAGTQALFRDIARPEDGQGQRGKKHHLGAAARDQRHAERAEREVES